MSNDKLSCDRIVSEDKSEILEDICIDDEITSSKKMMIFESTANGLLPITNDANIEPTATPTPDLKTPTSEQKVNKLKDAISNNF
jgi:hypothetical protein